MKRITMMLRAALVGLVRVYQRALRPLLPPSCRFHPSCSDYALAALREHGPWRGSLLAARRLLRCHPWNPGGYDPVLPGPVTPARPRSGAADR